VKSSHSACRCTSKSEMSLLRRLDVVAGAKGLARQGYQKRIYDSIILGRAGRSQQKRIYESIILGRAGRPPCTMFGSYTRKMPLSPCNSYFRSFNPVGRIQLLFRVRWSSNESKYVLLCVRNRRPLLVTANRPFSISSLISIHVDYEPATNLQDLIEVQKDRAIKKWKEAFSKQIFTSRPIYDAVLKQLNEKKVPPIYHTLCRKPPNRLFLPKTFVSKGKAESGIIKYSSKSVKPGLGTSNHRTNARIWKKNNFSYLHAFFSKAGKALINVYDISLKENWEFDKEISEMVSDLVNTSADMVGHDVEVTKLLSVFPFDRNNGQILITRSLSRGVVADCFEKSEAESVYAIVGSPGIGKSWSLIYALQQALLFENACVMFCFQKEQISWVCIRKEHRIYVWKMESEKFLVQCSSGLFKNENVLVLLDPQEAVDGGASYGPGIRRLIFAASNNLEHFSTSMEKKFAFSQRYLDPFTKNELDASAPFLSAGKKYSIDTVLKRAKIVGCIPRYVFDKKKFMKRKKVQDDYIKSIRNENISLQAVFNWSGMMKEKDTVPGSIFIVSAKKSKTKFNVGYDEEDLSDDGQTDDEEDLDDDEETDDDESIENDEDSREIDDDDGEFLDDYGYDGERIKDYGEMDVSIISSDIYLRLTKNSRANLLTYLGKVSPGDYSEMGYAVEAVFWKDLRKKNLLMKCWKFGDRVKDLNDIMFKPETVLDDATFSDLLDKVFGGDKQTVCRMVDGYNVIEFATSPRCVIQVTVSPPENRQLKVSGLKSLFLALRFLECDASGNISMTRSTVKEKLKFYWAVPFSLKKSWINGITKKKQGIGISKNKYQKDFEHYDVVNECYQKYVDSYVILIEKRESLNGRKTSGKLTP
jgi:hypothetical protein